MNCQYCGKECKNKNSLIQHEIRCKENPYHIICFGNKNNMPKHKYGYYHKPLKMTNGDVIDITQEQLDKYKESHNVCEICGKTINEAIKRRTKFSPKNLCVDHDHKTLKFRGILCSTCNRQLGWYEKHKKEITDYLNKSV